jgi:hypothetical protein
VISVDFATQAAINPCESLMADILHVTANAREGCEEYHDLSSSVLGFKVYSYMTTLGSCIGYLIATIDWTNITSVFIHEDNVKMKINPFFTPEQSTFIVVTVLFVFTAVITLSCASETSSRNHSLLENKHGGSKDSLCNIEEQREHSSETTIPLHSSSNMINTKSVFQNQHQTNLSKLKLRLHSFSFKFFCQPLLCIKYFAKLFIFGINLILHIAMMALVYLYNIAMTLINKVRTIIFQSKIV